MEEDVSAEESVELLHPFGEAAWHSSPRFAEGEEWEAQSPGVQLYWTRVADGVLTAYDEEWPSIKAGL